MTTTTPTAPGTVRGARARTRAGVETTPSQATASRSPRVEPTAAHIALCTRVLGAANDLALRYLAEVEALAVPLLDLVSPMTEGEALVARSRITPLLHTRTAHLGLSAEDASNLRASLLHDLVGTRRR